MKTYAIGDIHGCLTALKTLLEALSPKEEDTIIFVGDYVDRGPDSKGVIDLLLNLSETHNCIFLMGNHEEKMLLSKQYEFEYGEWMNVWDADATLRSYGVSSIHDIPDDHWEFLRTLRCSYETESHLYVHANIEPDLPLAQQNSYTLTHKKLHPETAAPHQSGKTVILGHTAQKSFQPLNLGHTVCIDTDAGRNGYITCLEVNAGTYLQANEKGDVKPWAPLP